MTPFRYSVGDKVVITEDCLDRMRNSNRSCVTPQYPSDSFIQKAEAFLGIEGEVTHAFPPGYEITAKFGEQSFHMKDNWIAAAGSPIARQGSEELVVVAPSNRRNSLSM